MAILLSLLAFLGGYFLALLFFLGRTPGRRHTGLLAVTLFLSLAAPLAIPASAPVYRCLIATTLLFLLMKSWEVYLHPKKYVNLSLRQYASFQRTS